MNAICRSHFTTFLPLALMLSACTPTPPAGWSGYVEGEYLYISSALGGTIATLAVRPGEQAVAGATLFTLDPDSELAARKEADARLTHAQAAARNLDKGRRTEELAVVQAQLAQARTQAQQAASDLAREQQLVQQGFVSAARSDTLRTALAQARARVDELQAQVLVAKLPARSDERAAAQADTEAATQAVKQLAWREAQKARTAPLGALVADTFFRVGEWVAPGQPVLSLLPAANIKVRFFVAQGDLAALKIGTPVQLHCDGCAAPIAAQVSFIANRAEYTPPVIYSNAQRAKLVFLLEARPQPKDAALLKPGQPVDVTLRAGNTP
jgi:HlyD family secretion protein